MARSFYSGVAVISDPATGNAKALADIEVTVSVRGGSAAQIYVDAEAATVKSNPFITDVSGAIEFWAEPGQYQIDLEDTWPSPRMDPQTISWDAIAYVDVSGLIPPGTISITANRFAPPGWLFCDGSQISRSLYARLWDALRADPSGAPTASSPYGNGNGSTTFTLPDLLGRFPVGEDGGANRLSDNDAYGETDTVKLDTTGVSYLIVNYIIKT